MNATVAAKPPFRELSTDKVIARFLLVGIGAASTERSSRLRHPVAAVAPSEEDLIDLGQPLGPETEDETWTEANNERRCDLINRKYEGSLTPGEAVELARLQALMLRHRRRVAPLPLDDARRLYMELSAAAGAARAPADP